ncbi:Imm57 family immunity protein [Escherichia coli]|uniref:Imm57 family immunity protein n=1 Tax=Escherichia coli TaxID=562 RepID=UPI001FCEA206|nr:Imm57 family immunity protein [Escherichia coli]
MTRLLTIVLFFSISANAVTVNQFQRELDLADKEILWALISASTQEGRKACSLSYFSCKAAEAELGLAYMAANDNKAFLTSLSRIMMYKIDAGLSESYTCYLLSKGKIIRPYLKNLNPQQLVADCIETVNKIKDKNKKIIDIDSVNICNDNKNINWRVNSTIVAIDDSIKCIDE